MPIKKGYTRQILIFIFSLYKSAVQGSSPEMPLDAVFVYTFMYKLLLLLLYLRLEYLFQMFLK